MGYTGKPSTGCGRCKERRKKCDGRRPQCDNCLKLKKPCPGFPDQLELMFKNETARVVRKVSLIAEGRKDSVILGSKSQRSSPDDGGGEGDDEENDRPSFDIKVVFSNPLTSPELPSRASRTRKFDSLDWIDYWDPAAQLAFIPSIERQIISFWFRNFVLRSLSTEITRGFFEVVIPMFEASRPNSALVKATEAAAVRAVANFTGGQYLLPLADQLYRRAMQSTQRSILDPEHATTDETLLCILLFALYESIATSKSDNWSRHIRGAVSIVRARGVTQFNNARSLCLFRATRSQMLFDAIDRREGIPDFPGPKGWLGDQTSVIPDCLIEHSVRLPNILATAKSLLNAQPNPLSTALVHDLLRDAYALQEELFEWDLHMPAAFGYTSFMPSAEQTARESRTCRRLWQGPVHVYKDVQIASIRNNNRVSQLLCCGVVLDSIRWLDPRGYVVDVRYRAMAYKAQCLVDDIAASVAFNLGYDPVLHQTRAVTGFSRSALTATGAYYLLSPLHAAVESTVIPAAQRHWLQEKINFIEAGYRKRANITAVSNQRPKPLASGSQPTRVELINGT